ncbi:trypsin-like serine protease [Aquimarina aquimarini]|uniref:trypsin-like serine protease n=1 Tax=Aquimarina aquimarini TaxID=1191734 RepID=UPI000D55F29E|nr:trypsin-like serine protease [Aquimarina aquimarini]
MKKIYLLILSLIICLSVTELQAQVKPDSENNPSNVAKIKNGEDVLIENHPYQADLGGCGGTIIGPTWILTAEHCVGGIVGRRIGVGYTKRSDRSTGQTSTVKRVIKFPCSGCDLSLLELSTPLDLSGRYAKAIKYASADVFTEGYVKQGKDCYATGWGQLGPNGGSPDHLQGASLKFGVVQLSDERIRVEETEGRMVCRGDSGGPLVVYNSNRSERILVGAVSGGEGTPCTDYGFWGNVANAASWIESQTGIKPYTETGSTDNVAPTRPTNLTASNPTQTTIDLAWTASTDNVGVTGYEVYRGNTMITTVAETRYKAVSLTAGTEYTFKVLAIDAAGNKSEFSNIATATTLPGDPTDICNGVAPWSPNVSYQPGDRVVHRGNLWERTFRGWKFISSCSANKSGKIIPPEDKISVYPVPANKEIHILFNPAEKAVFNIIDMFGKTVLQGKYRSNINITKLQAGTYTLKVISNGASYTTSFVKK